MKINKGYKTYDTGKYKITIDNDMKMLECPECKCRIYLDSFLDSVGTKGLNYCPYCGYNIKDETNMTIFDFMCK